MRIKWQIKRFYYIVCYGEANYVLLKDYKRYRNTKHRKDIFHYFDIYSKSRCSFYQTVVTWVAVT